MSHTLIELRDEITTLDTEIIILLEKRMQVSQKIAEYKRENNLPIFDSVREQEIIEKYSQMVDFDITHIYQAIMNESKKIQKNRVI